MTDKLMRYGTEIIQQKIPACYAEADTAPRAIVRAFLKLEEK